MVSVDVVEPWPGAAGAEADRRAARCWLGVAVLDLLLAGALALLLVLARTPPFDALVTDPGFFRRCLVVHVDLSILVWFYSFLAALLLLLPARPAAGMLTRASPWLGLAGTVLIVAAAWLPGTEAVMSNYLPMVDHWLFAAGLAIFATGVAAVVLSRDLLGRSAARPWLPVPPGALTALRTAAVALLLAGLTLFSTWLALPAGLTAHAHYELLYWGMGHVLQVASVAGMLAAWQILLTRRTGRPALGPRQATLWSFVLLLPWLAAPLLPAAGVTTSTYQAGFTRLMQFGLAPAVLAFLAGGFLALRRGPAAGCRDPATSAGGSAFVASATLTLAGFALGACIRGPSTIIPGHYHANIGAVTVAFMATSYLMLEPLGLRRPQGRLARAARCQPALYGAGQLVFALGFALAGAAGAARKVFGAEQAERGALETLGLAVMGAGGLAAIAGGVSFLVAMVAAWRRPAPAPLPSLVSS
jgi:hypothetical protein